MFNDEWRFLDSRKTVAIGEVEVSLENDELSVAPPAPQAEDENEVIHHVSRALRAAGGTRWHPPE